LLLVGCKSEIEKETMSIVFLDPQNQEVCGYNFTLPKGRGTRLALSAKPDKRLKGKSSTNFYFYVSVILLS